MPTRERLRARVSDLLEELEGLADTLDPDDDTEISMSDEQIARRLDRIEASIQDLSAGVSAIRETLAGDRVRGELAQAQAATALDEARVAREDARRAIEQAQAAREAREAQAARQEALDGRLREVEQAERDRRTRGATLAGVAGVGGATGLGSLIWQVVTAWGWIGG